MRHSVLIIWECEPQHFLTAWPHLNPLPSAVRATQRRCGPHRGHRCSPSRQVHWKDWTWAAKKQGLLEGIRCHAEQDDFLLTFNAKNCLYCSIWFQQRGLDNIMYLCSKELLNFSLGWVIFPSLFLNLPSGKLLEIISGTASFHHRTSVKNENI